MVTGEGATMEPMETIALDALPEAIQRRLKAAGVDEVEPEDDDYDSHDETPEQARQRRLEAAQARSASWRARLPQRYAEAALTDLEPQYREPIERWIADREALTLVLAGEIGTGKTHAAYAIGNWAVSRGSGVLAWHLHDLLVAMRPDGDPSAYDRACNVPLLIVDDLGAVKATDWARDTMLALVDHRLNHKRRTIWTTNQHHEALLEHWHPRMLDRITEASAAVVFKGASRRKAAW